ncbi:MAG: hypothetical protein AAGP08_04825 [Pseudomonadota bacterium]
MQPPSLTLFPLLDHWDAAQAALSVNILVIPASDPLSDFANPAAPMFTGADVILRAHLSTDPTVVPTLASVPATGGFIALSAPAGQTQIFKQFAQDFKITVSQQAFERKTEFRLKKYLPKTYRGSFDFVAPKTPLAVIDDSYFCALRCPPKAPIVPQNPFEEVSWGEVFAMAMRQPSLARACGLLHTVTVPLPSGHDEGWLFFNLDPGGIYAAEANAHPDFLRTYATRLPELKANTARPVFTAVSFPVARDAAHQASFGPLDEVFDEARTFDDGFAKVVHARQPVTTDLAADDGAGPPLYSDPGIQLGWDDEDVLIGMNRGVSDTPDGSQSAEAPSGIAGYRVDVRNAGGGAWTSLCKIKGAGPTFAGIQLDPLDGELAVEVHPTQLNTEFWLPSYYTKWIGGSIVEQDEETEVFLGKMVSDPSPYEAIEADQVPLRYGQDYDFRVRLVDLAGGGPGDDLGPTNAGARPIVSHAMRRQLPIRAPKVETLFPSANAPTAIEIKRPRINFPGALFTGHPDALKALRQVVIDNAALPFQDRKPIDMPDPDAALCEVNVLVEMPTFDAAGGRDGFHLLSRSYRAFPDLVDALAEAPLVLELDWITTPRLSDVAWPMATMPVAGTGAIQVPTARNIRIEIRAVGAIDLSYFATEEAAYGEDSELWQGTLRVAAPETAPLFAGISPQDALRSVFLQPEPVPASATQVAPSQTTSAPIAVQRLAYALDLPSSKDTIYAPPGRRILFSCNGLQSYQPPDGSSLTLASPEELARTWINVVRIPIARDWSWQGLDLPSFDVTRTIALVGQGGAVTKTLTAPVLRHAVPQSASRGVPDRESFELVIVDAFTPPLDGNGHPHEVELSYSVTAREAAPRPSPEVFSIGSRLPVASAPRQTPRLVSAGHALSPYSRMPDYSETGDRSRLLWLEFAEDPRKDPRDILYARILANAPDPMLLPEYEPDQNPADLAPIALDPEAIRVIRPEQPEDFAGLSAMAPLIPATGTSPVHFALPLPPDLEAESPELFGFFTVEFRFGHPESQPGAPFWSTAQGRFGPPLVMEGVQFPAPSLQLTVVRQTDGARFSAPYAQPVRDGRRVPLRRPNTEMWFVLYARVMQVDLSTYRNIPILRQRGRLSRPTRPGQNLPMSAHRWSLDEMTAGLARLGLPEDTPLSVMAIEILPEPNGAFSDPLGRDLGEVRILRSSRLMEVPVDCCVH